MPTEQKTKFTDHLPELADIRGPLGNIAAYQVLNLSSKPFLKAMPEINTKRPFYGLPLGVRDPYAVRLPDDKALYHRVAKEMGLRTKQTIAGMPAFEMFSDRYRFPSYLSQQLHAKDIFGRLLGTQRNKIMPIAPGILAHEYGHKQQLDLLEKVLRNRNLGKGLMTAGVLGMKLGPAGAMTYNLFTDSETNARKAALLGSVAALPGLGMEFDAARRGTGILKRLAAAGPGRRPIRLLGKHLWSPWIGLPSYLALTAAPLVSYQTKKMLGGYSQK